MVPSWPTLRFEAEVEVVLFSFPDRPVQDAIGIHREASERFAPAGSISSHSDGRREHFARWSEFHFPRGFDMNLFRPLSATVFALLLPFAASAADLKVTVTDGPTVPATLFVALFDSAEAFAADKPLVSQKVPMRDGTAQFAFAGLAAGRYVIKSFADENGNEKLDTNLVGLPTERYGFSNDAKGRMGSPSFDAAAVKVDADSTIAFRLH